MASGKPGPDPFPDHMRKTRQANARFTADEFALLSECARRMGISVGVYASGAAVERAQGTKATKPFGSGRRP